jgi:tetratricopeptide (TPR) repeat protein
MLLPVLLFLQTVAAQAPLPDVVTRAKIDHARGVNFHALVTPETVYVGQQATYQLGVFIDPATRQRLRRNPEFVPPESQAMLAYDLPDRGGPLAVTIGGTPYETHVFRRALFPLTAGRYEIGAARLNYTLPQSASFFSREENFSLRSEQTAVVAIDVPTAGRPAGWLGAVGVWRASASIDTARGRAGDPLVLTLRIEGTGNVTLLPRPALTIGWAGVVPADERVRLDSTPAVMRGYKEFDWLITPKLSGVQRVPSLRFSYFNPYAKRYEFSDTDPFEVRVAPGAVVAADSAVAVAPVASMKRPSLRLVIGDQTATPIGDFSFVRWLLIFAPFPSIGIWLFRRPRKSPRARTAAERLKQLSVESGAGPSDVRTAFLASLRDRTGLDPATLTGAGAWARALRREGVGNETAHAVSALLDRLDAAAFGPPPHQAGAAAASRADELRRAVDAEARRLRRAATPTAGTATPIVALVLALGLVFTVARAASAFQPDRARAAFAAATAAYAAGDYARSARLFADAAASAPGSANAWANVGVASWAAGDSANAVVGWQRALRLDPTSNDLREQLGKSRAPQDAGFALVPALPARLPSFAALLLWLVGWGVVAFQCWRRRPALPFAIVTIVVAGTMALAARSFELTLEARDLTVVVDPAALRSLPALGAESASMPIAGEIAHIDERRGVWTRITLDGARAGWIPTERLAPLARN